MPQSSAVEERENQTFDAVKPTQATRIVGSNAVASETKATVRLDSIDGLRAIACTAVMVCHAYLVAGSPVWNVCGKNVLYLSLVGSTGVSLFFVLSGFCLFTSLAKQQTYTLKLKSFFKRRALRILPAYYAAIAFCIAVNVLTGSPLPNKSSLFEHLLLVQGLIPKDFFDINGAFWSLSLEAQFYLIFPLLCWAFIRKGPLLSLAVIAIINLGYRVIVEHCFRQHNMLLDAAICYQLPGRLLEFGLGMLAAWQYARQKPNQNCKLFPWFLVFAILMILAGGTTPLVAFSDISWGIAYYLVLTAVLMPGSPATRLLSSPPLVALGKISYSFYLVHTKVLLLVAVATNHSFSRILTLGFIGSVIVATVFYQLFEKPCLSPSRTQQA